MDTVNWVKSGPRMYKVRGSAVMNCFFKQLFDVDNREVFWYDPELGDDQPGDFQRVLDDSPGDWRQFLRYDTGPEYHTGFVKNQADGCTLYKLIESYPGATQLPPIYILTREN